MIDPDAGAGGETTGTGFPSLDAVLGGGLRRGDLVILGGDTGSGKSSLALAIAARASAAGNRTVFLSSEMHVTRVRERLVAMRQRTSIDELRREKATDPNAGEPAAESDAPALRTFLPGSTVDSLVNEIRTDFDLDLVVVDHLHSLATMARPLDEELADSVRRLKAAALEAQVALLLVVSGGADSAVAGARPALAHFGALGAVRQHADVILGIYREEMYESTRGIDGATEVHVLKNRHGKTGYVDLYFYKEWLRFEDMLE